MDKDRRVKGCTNASCERNIKKHKYKASDNYCTLCGSNLVFVCSGCFSKIEDNGPHHKFCKRCEEIREERKEKVKDFGQKAKELAPKAALVVPVVAGKMKGVDPKNAKAVVKAAGAAAMDIAKKIK